MPTVGREFTLIRAFFADRQAVVADVQLGIGDDCALLVPNPGEVLAVTTDTLVSGVHFPVDGPAEQIGQRALRVNLSDLAAMGAEPRWFQLALTLPVADDAWVEAFSRGLFAAAKAYSIALVGGDTTRGPLCITITAIGALPAGEALRRDGAKPGDRIYVTGTLGDGAAGLAVLSDRSGQPHLNYLQQRYWRPSPRLAEGRLLRGLASAAIDISDGLLADLGHIAQRSGVGARIHTQRLPVAAPLRRYAHQTQWLDWALAGGDDYELCFTVPPANLDSVNALVASGRLAATPIGWIIAGAGVVCRDQLGRDRVVGRAGYDHFER
ncbi:MAG: thiamine-phosphate kinase [Porticoccaceae bacterium]